MGTGRFCPLLLLKINSKIRVVANCVNLSDKQYHIHIEIKAVIK